LAVILLEELANTHAIVQTLADMQIATLAKEIQLETGIKRDDALKIAAADFEKVRLPRAEKFFRENMNRLNLSGIEKGNPPQAAE
jgi:hypothetical protein